MYEIPWFLSGERKTFEGIASPELGILWKYFSNIRYFYIFYRNVFLLQNFEAMFLWNEKAIGNVVGSNIFNTFLILGASAGISPLKVTTDSVTDLWVNIGVSVLLFIFVFTGKGRQINRWEGALFLTLYITYLTLLIVS